MKISNKYFFLRCIRSRTRGFYFKKTEDGFFINGAGALLYFVNRMV